MIPKERFMNFRARFACLFAGAFLLACSENSTSSETPVEPVSPIVEPSSSSFAPDEPSSAAEESSSSLFVHIEGFSPCQFNFGAGWQAAHEDSSFYAGLDYISVWLGDNDFFNSFESRMFDMTRIVHATPMIYAYVIAEFGKDHGLVDCDIKDSDGNFKVPNHCTEGANIIREFFQDSILYRYREYASGFRDLIETYPNMDPDTVQFIWLIEPDFYQYSVSGSEQHAQYTSSDAMRQNGGGIPDSMMGVYFSQIVDTIRAYLPASKIAIDISPWANDQAAWYSNFDLSIVDYASTSGGRTSAASERIKASDKATWAGIFQLLGKPILADAGYDAGGYGTGYNKAWGKIENINARIANGVIGVTQMDADSLYHVRVTIARPQLSSIPGCGE